MGKCSDARSEKCFSPGPDTGRRGAAWWFPAAATLVRSLELVESVCRTDPGLSDAGLTDERLRWATALGWVGARAAECLIGERGAQPGPTDAGGGLPAEGAVQSR